MFLFFKSKAQKISAYLDEGDEALSAGALTRAYEAGQRAAKLGAVEGYALMARVLGAEGHADEVIAVLRQATYDVPGWRACHFLIMALGQVEQFGECVAVCNRALSFADVDSELILYCKATALRNLGLHYAPHYDEALACLAKEPASIKLQLGYARERTIILRILKRYPQARNEAERALANKSLHQDDENNLGELYY